MDQDHGGGGPVDEVTEEGIVVEALAKCILGLEKNEKTMLQCGCWTHRSVVAILGLSAAGGSKLAVRQGQDAVHDRPRARRFRIAQPITLKKECTTRLTETQPPSYYSYIELVRLPPLLRLLLVPLGFHCCRCCIKPSRQHTCSRVYLVHRQRHYRCYGVTLHDAAPVGFLANQTRHV